MITAEQISDFWHTGIFNGFSFYAPYDKIDDTTFRIANDDNELNIPNRESLLIWKGPVVADNDDLRVIVVAFNGTDFLAGHYNASPDLKFTIDALPYNAFEDHNYATLKIVGKLLPTEKESFAPWPVK